MRNESWASMALRRLSDGLLWTELERRAADIPEPRRREASRHISLARQRLAGARVLWRDGHLAEGMLLVDDALEGAMRAVQVLAPTERPTEFLQLRRAPARAVAIAALLDGSGRDWASSRDRDFRAKDREGLVSRLWLCERVLHLLELEALEPGAIRHRRRARTGMVLVGSVAVVVAAFLALRTPDGVFVTASASYGDLPDFEARRAMDGDESTSWLLPNHSDGWLEATIRPPRRVRRVRLLNTANPPFLDRATLAYDVEMYSEDHEVYRASREFVFQPSPEWVVHEVQLDALVDRVRVSVRTWHAWGGGLAEIAVE